MIHDFNGNLLGWETMRLPRVSVLSFDRCTDMGSPLREPALCIAPSSEVFDFPHANSLLIFSLYSLPGSST